MAYRIAVKRLSAVEVDPARSNQHELHAGRLRTELGLETVAGGSIEFILLGQRGEIEAVINDQYTLYDARKGNPLRAAEWRLYFRTTALGDMAAPGDAMFLYAAASGLVALIAPKASEAERVMSAALGIGDQAIETHFRFSNIPVPRAQQAAALATQLTLPVGSPPYDVTAHATFQKGVREHAIPSTAEMASAARDLVGQPSPSESPDDYLTRALAAETRLYFSVEEAVRGEDLQELLGRSPDLTQIIAFSSRVQQSRRSRRGQSLQNHFAALLRAHSIPFTPQCPTESGETPDFVVPGAAAYHDPAYPAMKLRMVACKSTAKERWRQVLNEAARIEEKYLLTIDESLTHTSLEAMRHAKLSVFLPASLIATIYGASPVASRPQTVAALLDHLHAAT